MTDTPPYNEPSTFEAANETVRNVARDVRDTLTGGQTPGQWKNIVSDLVRETPLGALTIAFMLGYMVARRR